MLEQRALFCDCEERRNWVKTGGKYRINGCEFLNTNRSSFLLSLLRICKVAGQGVEGWQLWNWTDTLGPPD